MTASVDFGKFPDIDVRVNLGRVEAGVAEHFLDVTVDSFPERYFFPRDELL